MKIYVSIVLVVFLSGCQHVASSSLRDDIAALSSSKLLALENNTVFYYENNNNLDRDKIVRIYWEIGSNTSNLGVQQISDTARLRHVLWYVKEMPGNSILSEQAGSDFSRLPADPWESLVTEWSIAIGKHPGNNQAIRNALKCCLDYPNWNTNEDISDITSGWIDLLGLLPQQE